MNGIRLATLKAVPVGVFAALLFCLHNHAVAAAPATYPSKPILLVIPYEAGGSIDIVGRMVADLLSKRLKTPIVVEQRPGGGGIIGTERVARANADGHTLLMQNPSLLTTMVVGKPPYDLKAFTPVARLASNVNGLAVSAKVQANSLKELIALARQQPGKLLAATTAVGASAHIGLELFKIMAGIDVKTVHFKGAGQSVTDVVGGHSDMTSSSITNLMPHMKSGRIRILATGGTKRAIFLPDIPTISEAGVPGYEHINWWGIVAPAGVPAPVLSRLTAEIKAVMEDEETKKLLTAQGAEIDLVLTGAFGAELAKELGRVVEVVKKARINTE